MLVPVLQVAGHTGALQSENGAIFVKKTKKPELDFYRELNDGSHVELAEKTCLFMGLLTEINANEQSMESLNDQGMMILTQQQALEAEKVNQIDSRNVTIVLENAIYGFKQPNIMDVKLGSILYDDTADEDKIERLKQVSVNTTSGSMGLRIAGMNIYDSKRHKRIAYDRLFGRQFDSDNIHQAFDKFFIDTVDDPERKTIICDVILAELEELKQVLETTEARFISSSVLIIYEGDQDEFDRKLTTDKPDTEDDEDDDIPTPLINIRLIDFAHSKFTPNSGKDTNVLQGIESLISIFKHLFDT